MSGTPTTGKQKTFTGKIFFIGAGPGNPDLITVRGAALFITGRSNYHRPSCGDEIH
jgi:hypothetical protein